MTARYYGLHNLIYEGRPGMDDRNQIDLPNMIAANGDSRMGQQVTQALTGAFQNGVDIYTYFGSSGGWTKYGMWGATNDIFDLTQPKWKALQTLSGKNITRTLAVVDPQSGPNAGFTLPGTINAGKPNFGVIGGTVGTGTNAGYCLAAANGLPDMCMLRADKPGGNTQYGYMRVAPTAGSCTITLKFDARSTTPAASAQFYVNQQPQEAKLTVPASAAGTASPPASFSITLPSGISLLELEATSGFFGINSIVITSGK